MTARSRIPCGVVGSGLSSNLVISSVVKNPGRRLSNLSEAFWLILVSGKRDGTFLNVAFTVEAICTLILWRSVDGTRLALAIFWSNNHPWKSRITYLSTDSGKRRFSSGRCIGKNPFGCLKGIALDVVDIVAYRAGRQVLFLPAGKFKKPSNQPSARVDTVDSSLAAALRRGAGAFWCGG